MDRRRALNLCLLSLLIGAFALVGGLLFVTREDPRDVASALRQRIERAARPTLIKDRLGRRLGVFSEEARYPVRLSEVPKMTQKAFLAAEDADFYSHPGVSWRGILRSLVVNMRRERVAQGGSTITQQLVRQYFLTRERSFVRKIREIYLALRLESQLSKQEILELWLNGVYLGNNAWGIEAAAQHYFRKSAVQLTLGESAILAGLPQAPSRYAPHHHPGAARARKHYVLKQMVSEGWLSKAEASRAWTEKVSVFRDRSVVESSAPWVTEATRNELWRRLEVSELPRSGLMVETHIDRDWQYEAQKVFAEQFRPFEKSGLEAGMAVVDLGSGAIRALVGGLNHEQSQFNRATMLSRPFGSALFPLIFAWASDAGVTILQGGHSLSSAAILSRFMDADRVAAVLGYGAVRERFLQMGLKVRGEEAIEQVQGSPLSLALIWRAMAGRPITPAASLLRSVRLSDGSALKTPQDPPSIPGISEASSYSLKTWLGLVRQDQEPSAVLRFDGTISWNHWEIAANDAMVSVLWVGADRRPTGRPEQFHQMQATAKQAMNLWLTRTQNTVSRPQRKVPAGLSWHLLKTRDGRMAHVPFPSSIQ